MPQPDEVRSAAHRRESARAKADGPTLLYIFALEDALRQILEVATDFNDERYAERLDEIVGLAHKGLAL